MFGQKRVDLFLPFSRRSNKDAHVSLFRLAIWKPRQKTTLLWSGFKDEYSRELSHLIWFFFDFTNVFCMFQHSDLSSSLANDSVYRKALPNKLDYFSLLVRFTCGWSVEEPHLTINGFHRHWAHGYDDLTQSVAQKFWGEQSIFAKIGLYLFT